jgi:hypothetical protein
MLTNLYFLLLCIFVAGCLVGFRYYQNRKNIEVLEGVEKSGGSVEEVGAQENKLEETKDFVFAFFDDVRVIAERQTKFFFHWFLHFFVIILGFISDIFDWLYSIARDSFLKTATKEKQVVVKFWHHLKEYKREREEGK